MALRCAGRNCDAPATPRAEARRMTGSTTSRKPDDHRLRCKSETLGSRAAGCPRNDRMSSGLNGGSVQMAKEANEPFGSDVEVAPVKDPLRPLGPTQEILKVL